VWLWSPSSEFLFCILMLWILLKVRPQLMVVMSALAGLSVGDEDRKQLHRKDIN